MKKKLMAAMCAALCVTVFFNDIVWAAEYEYDKLGRVTKVTYEDKSSITYEYDANGNIVSVIRTKGEQETTSKPEQETSGGESKEPAETTGSSCMEENPSKETIGIDETISGTENIADEKSDTGKIGLWQKIWNGITGFFLGLWSVIKSIFLWLWSLLKGLFELIFGN